MALHSMLYACLSVGTDLKEAIRISEEKMPAYRTLPISVYTYHP